MDHDVACYYNYLCVFVWYKHFMQVLQPSSLSSLRFSKVLWTFYIQRLVGGPNA